MILLKGEEWGTAAEVANRLGDDVTVAMIRNWSRRDGLSSATVTGANGRPAVHYPLRIAAEIERAKRQGGRGRRRAA
ncbi:hypothetical protein [Catenuloplanes atrovinosus]|uniref:Uncharacterized protein n=1 Tax=Catenuloplanes atrovinosus TaxID=137266 RepID=A0AAE4CC76_9ACTN|nr:hypothetical protein [Catenuloplanes atrovinosus]MDR7278922.1 hypothetical protein [Catenuloplanes atrovinosus]